MISNVVAIDQTLRRMYSDIDTIRVESPSPGCIKATVSSKSGQSFTPGQIRIMTDALDLITPVGTFNEVWQTAASTLRAMAPYATPDDLAKYLTPPEGYVYHDAKAPKPAPYAGRECPCGLLSGCEYHHEAR
jgi:hypothetical protein